MVVSCSLAFVDCGWLRSVGWCLFCVVVRCLLVLFVARCLLFVARCVLLVVCLLLCALCGRSLSFVGFVRWLLASFIGRRWLLLVACCALFGVRGCWLFRVRSCVACRWLSRVGLCPLFVVVVGRYFGVVYSLLCVVCILLSVVCGRSVLFVGFACCLLASCIVRCWLLLACIVVAALCVDCCLLNI